MNTNFGEQLRLLRGDRIQKEVAHLFGVVTSTWSSWEKGQSEPKYSILIEIAQHFNVTTDYLLGLSSAKTEKPSATNIDWMARALKAEGALEESRSQNEVLIQALANSTRNTPIAGTAAQSVPGAKIG